MNTAATAAYKACYYVRCSEYMHWFNNTFGWQSIWTTSDSTMYCIISNIAILVAYRIISTCRYFVFKWIWYSVLLLSQTLLITGKLEWLHWSSLVISMKGMERRQHEAISITIHGRPSPWADYPTSRPLTPAGSHAHEAREVTIAMSVIWLAAHILCCWLFVLPSLRHLSESERLSYLHWLPVNYRIQFKIATLTYKTLATCQPSYLYNLLQVYHPARVLHSSTQQLLHVPYMSTEGLQLVLLTQN